MKKNVIILTSGLTGSSVLTGLIARAGYWTGDETFKKRDYETFENSRLIELNLRLFKEAGYRGNYLLEFSEPAMKAIAELPERLNLADYRSFVQNCNERGPWIWKDPRLWLTIRFWRRVLDLSNCQFILLTRGPMQSWISSILRRQIVSYRYSQDYERKIRDSILSFVQENGLSCLHLQYEGLISRPAEAIRELNEFLGTSLSVADLQAIYHKPLYRSPRNSLVKHIKAMLIYIKNYSERLDIRVEQ